MSTGFTLVEEPLIEYIIDQEDGREYKSEEYISASARDIAYIRMRVFDAMRRGEPNIICAACHSPAYPRKNFNTRKFHFVHVSINSSKECPYNEKSKRFNTERIDSMRYNGQKEGPDHKYLKKLLRASIDADLRFDPSQTREEKNWYGAKDEKKWRRPDISATRQFGDGSSLKIAFELQLSATYLKVISARREFYLEENALLFWLFKDAKALDPRQYQDDLFYNNNSNLFVIDEETLHLSMERKKFTFRCFYYEPMIDGICVKDVWREHFVSFDELTWDISNQRVYRFDYDGKKAHLLKEAEQNARKKEEQDSRLLYENFWIRYTIEECKGLEREYEELRHALSVYGIIIPEYPDNRELNRFNRIVFSAKDGKAVMTGLKTLLEVANDAYKNGKQLMWYFGRVLSHYGNWKVLITQDQEAERKKKLRGEKHISWQDKGKSIKRGIDNKDEEFRQNRSYDKLFFFLFPEISQNQEHPEQD